MTWFVFTQAFLRAILVQQASQNRLLGLRVDNAPASKGRGPRPDMDGDSLVYDLCVLSVAAFVTDTNGSQSKYLHSDLYRKFCCLGLRDTSFGQKL